MGLFLRWLYTGLFTFALPFVLLRLWWRALKAPAYGDNIAERFAFFAAPNTTKNIWLHAVSMGEFMAATVLIKALRKQYPDYHLIVTTTTATGRERVQTLLGDSVFYVYAPYDLPWIVNKFLKKVTPALAIIMETELWPNLIGACEKRSIPVFVANARLSARSQKGYLRVAPLSYWMMQHLSLVGAQTETDAARFRGLGLSAEKVRVLGNLKFSQAILQSASEIAMELKSTWGHTRLVWVGASTHEGEEVVLLRAHEKILTKFPDALLILVPRHPERFSKVIHLAQKQSLRTAVRSKGNVLPESQVLVGDTMGELMAFYAASDVAFVGGTLAVVGGHNVLEPAALGVPTLAGPHTFNMQGVYEAMVACGATKRVHDVDELASAVTQLLMSSVSRREKAAAGLALIEKNKGAVEKHMQAIADLFAARRDD